jgi:hypothetical protein
MLSLFVFSSFFYYLDEFIEKLDILQKLISLMCSALSGFDSFQVSQLQRHAYIMTVRELATFAVDYPGMYRLLKATGVISTLDEMINEAKNIVLRYRRTKDQSGTSPRFLGDCHNKALTTTANSSVESHDSIYHSFSSSSTFIIEEKGVTDDKTTQ